MRVIAGNAKSHRLFSVPGDSTRPITDRAKEALFSILADTVIGARVLDVFAGTGAVGIEALSRGAAHAVFMDRNRRAVQTIQANLRHCKLEGAADVRHGDSFALLPTLRDAPFDLIFIAPPQYQELWRKTLLLVDGAANLLAPGGLVIVQIHPREDGPLELAQLVEVDRRRYGSVLLLFYARAADLDEDAENEDGENEDGENEDEG